MRKTLVVCLLVVGAAGGCGSDGKIVGTTAGGLNAAALDCAPVADDGTVLTATVDTAQCVMNVDTTQPVQNRVIVSGNVTTTGSVDSVDILVGDAAVVAKTIEPQDFSVGDGRVKTAGYSLYVDPSQCTQSLWFIQSGANGRVSKCVSVPLPGCACLQGIWDQ